MTKPSMSLAELAEKGADGDFLRLDKEAFTSCPSDSVDYAVMERIGSEDDLRAVVVPLDVGWSDVGA